MAANKKRDISMSGGFVIWFLFAPAHFFFTPLKGSQKSKLTLIMRERSNFLGIKSRISKIRELKMWFRGSNLLHRKRNSNPAITAHASTRRTLWQVKWPVPTIDVQSKFYGLKVKSGIASISFFSCFRLTKLQEFISHRKKNHFMWQKWFLSVKVSFLCPDRIIWVGPLEGRSSS